MANHKFLLQTFHPDNVFNQQLKRSMTLVINYKKYEMFSDEEQLIYEDDDDDESWGDNLQDQVEPASASSPSNSGRFEKVSIRDTLDNDYFLDRTLTSIGTPENRVWDLGTTTG